ncbi:ribonuclease P protein component [uncultured Draconibacterium sp.]|uniref:ribonuclease P protein component n=1 Tax=uncultured Draconibacterium sp. TaxID=1573823 RepID=UPI003217F67E
MNTTSANSANNKSFSLKKAERLSSKKIIDKLFAEGDSILQYPLKIVFLKTELPTEFPVQAGFTASKRNFKRAVARNRIKRLLRESYRLHKHILYDQLHDRQLAIFILYIGKEIPQYTAVENAIKKGFPKIVLQLADKKPKTPLQTETKNPEE